MNAGFDYREIDDVIHGRVRLAVMAFLSSALSDGNSPVVPFVRMFRMPAPVMNCR